MALDPRAYLGNPNAVDLVTLTQANPAGPRFRCHLLGDDTYTPGAAKWETLDRVHRMDVLEWTGSALATLVLPLRLDGYGVLPAAVSMSVEPQCDLLEAWTRPVTGVYPQRPPTITVDGPVRQPKYRPWWVITGLEWGEQIRGDDNVRIMQEVQVTLTEHLQGDVLAGSAAQARARAGIA